MGNWTDRFDPETVDEIKRYEKGQKDDGGNEFRD